MKNRSNIFEDLSVLIVDDEPDVSLGLKHLMATLGFEVDTAPSAEEGLDKMAIKKFDLVLSDVSMPGMKGNEFLYEIKKKWPFTEVVLITGYGTIDMAVNCLQAGAAHFISKPFDNDEILNLVEKMGRKILAERTMLLEGPQKSKVICESRALKNVFDLVDQVAPTKVPVLIEGRTGTGKEVIANALHERSTNKDKEFLAVNCAALPDTLLESELFGHKKGAFTGAENDRVGLFAKAKGGTIFLDEISSMSLVFQGKLLRVLQEKVVRPLGSDKDFEIDFRLVSATNKDLMKMIENNEFREDLYYRICTMKIEIPSLNQRQEDVIALANFFLHECSKDCLVEGAKVPNFSVEAIDKLNSYDWPGNVRELKNVIQSALIMCQEDTIRPHHLPISGKNKTDENLKVEPMSFDYEKGKQKVVEKFQRQLIDSILIKTHGNVTHASERCGLTRAAFQKIMKTLEIDRTKYQNKNYE